MGSSRALSTKRICGLMPIDLYNQFQFLVFKRNKVHHSECHPVDDARMVLQLHDWLKSDLRALNNLCWQIGKNFGF